MLRTADDVVVAVVT